MMTLRLVDKNIASWRELTREHYTHRTISSEGDVTFEISYTFVLRFETNSRLTRTIDLRTCHYENSAVS